MRYRDIYASLLRYCADVLDELKLFEPNLSFLVLDSVPELAQLPAGDNFYLFGLTTENSTEHFHIYVNGFLGFKVLNDPNLMRLETKYLDYIIHELIEQKKVISIYDEQTGEIIGKLIFDGTFETTPARINDAATFKNVAFTLLTPQALITGGN